jgi:hypothetical protein
MEKNPFGHLWSLTRNCIVTVNRKFGVCWRRGRRDGKSSCYKKFRELGIDWVTPPQREAVCHDLKREPWMKQRNDAIRAIAALGNDEEARSIWKKLKEYHRRSLAETGVSRFKMIFGSGLKAREIRRQRAEAHGKAIAMNKMNRLGMPKGRRVN